MNMMVLPVIFWVAGFSFFIAYSYYMIRMRRAIGRRASEWSSGNPRPLTRDEIETIYTIPEGLHWTGTGMFTCALLMMLSFIILLALELVRT